MIKDGENFNGWCFATCKDLALLSWLINEKDDLNFLFHESLSSFDDKVGLLRLLWSLNGSSSVALYINNEFDACLD